jgi:hypothetical protein
MTDPDAGHSGASPRPAHGGGGETAAAASAAWAAWEEQLAQAVTSLADGDVLLVTVAAGLERPALVRRGFLRGFVPARHELVAPWVRLARMEDHVRGTCVGAVRFGGPFPFSPEEDEALVSVGWRRPGSGDGTDYVRFWPDDVPQGPFLPPEEARRVAAVVARTFREVLTPPGPAPDALAPDAPALPVVTPEAAPQSPTP